MEPAHGGRRRRAGLTVVACVVSAVAIAFLARELADRLALAYPLFAAEIRSLIGLALVLCVGVFCLRPVFAAYADPHADKPRR
ncbi:hypothetical protein SAMN04487939_11166 [Lysobacter sp. yr284]|uniref:hypothetical protein n=1 Tax=Lysobacter sp. yr284 TaxID=1761791 RepID=UPI0008956A1B|nr:hypothetical protein [Lysobacter sp. yr284]SDY99366.1 hypothetical protein SAMN04487939_11166 [Lysobacter sp. yr284]